MTFERAWALTVSVAALFGFSTDSNIDSEEEPNNVKRRSFG